MAKRKRFLGFAAAVGAVMASAGTARAQMSPDLIMETYNSNVNAIISSHINNLEIDNIVRGKAHHGGRSAGVRKSGGKTGSPSRDSAKGVVTTYTPSPAITRELRDALIARVRAKSPQSGDDVAKALNQHNFVAIWSGIVAPYGLKPNDAADALASYLLLGWTSANGVKDVTPAQAHGLREQLKTALNAMPSFAQASASNKQRIAESLMLEFVLRHGAAQKAERDGDATQTRQLAEAYQAQVQRTMGLNLRGLALTDAGFGAKG